MSALRQMSDHVVDLFQAAQSVLDNMRTDRDELRGRVEELEAQLLDAKRNEERVVAKLHTLEAAVRAVRDGDEGLGGDDRGLDMDFRPLDKLYALVSESKS